MRDILHDWLTMMLFILNVGQFVCVCMMMNRIHEQDQYIALADWARAHQLKKEQK